MVNPFAVYNRSNYNGAGQLLSLSSQSCFSEELQAGRFRLTQDLEQFRNSMQQRRLEREGTMLHPGHRTAFESIFTSPRRSEFERNRDLEEQEEIDDNDNDDDDDSNADEKIPVLEKKKSRRATIGQTKYSRLRHDLTQNKRASTTPPKPTLTQPEIVPPPSHKTSSLCLADLMEGTTYMDTDNEPFFASNQQYHVNRYHLVGIGGRPTSNHPFHTRHRNLAVRDALKAPVRKHCQSTRNPFHLQMNYSLGRSHKSNERELKRAERRRTRGDDEDKSHSFDRKMKETNEKRQAAIQMQHALGHNRTHLGRAAKVVEAYTTFCNSQGIAASSRVIDLVLGSLDGGMIDLALTFQSLGDVDIAGLQHCFEKFIDTDAGDSLRDSFPSGGIHLNLCENSITAQGCKHLRDMFIHQLPTRDHIQSEDEDGDNGDVLSSNSSSSSCSDSSDEEGRMSRDLNTGDKRGNQSSDSDSPIGEEEDCSHNITAEIQMNHQNQKRENTENRVLIAVLPTSSTSNVPEVNDVVKQPRVRPQTAGVPGRRASRRTRLRANLEANSTETNLEKKLTRTQTAKDRLVTTTQQHKRRPFTSKSILVPNIVKHGGNQTTDVSLPDDVSTGFFLKSLDLSDNKIRNDGVVCLLDAAIHECGARLAGLALRGNLLTDRIARKMEGYLVSCGSELYTLEMSKNSFGESFSRSLGRAMKSNMCNLRKLSLSWNPLNSKGGTAIARGLAYCTSIESVDLSFTSLRDDAGLELAAMLKDGKVPSLRLLDVSHNHFTGVTAGSFGQALVSPKQGLTELRAGFNLFGLKATLSLINMALGAHALTALCIENALNYQHGTEECMQKLYNMAQSVMYKVKPRRMHIAVEFPPRHRGWVNALQDSSLAPVKIVEKPHIVEAITESIFLPRVHESESRAFYDTTKLLNMAFKQDWALIHDKLKRFVKAAPECGMSANDCIEAVKKILRNDYVDLSNIFRYYSSSSSPSDAIGMNDFLDLIDDCKLQDGGLGGTLPMSMVEIIFVQANYELSNQGENPDTALCGFELFEAIVRCAQAKFMASASPVRAKHIGEALTMVLQNHLLVHCDRYDSNIFRKDHLYYRDMHDIFALNRKCIDVIWKHVSEGDAQVSFREWRNLLRTSKLLSDDFTVLEGTYAFYLSTMRVSIEMGPRSRGHNHNALSFVEFLEAIAHIAEWHDSERLGLPPDAHLSQKVAKVLFKVFHNVARGSKKLERTAMKEYFDRMDPLNTGKCEEDFLFLRTRHMPLLDPSKTATGIVAKYRSNTDIVLQDTSPMIVRSQPGPRSKKK